MTVIVIFLTVTSVVLYTDIDVTEKHGKYYFLSCKEKNRGPRSGPCSCLPILNVPQTGPRFLCSSRRCLSDSLPSSQTVYISTLKKESVYFSETSISIHKTTRRQKLENHNTVKGSDASFGSLCIGWHCT
jgi:hypothetical protein